jgi:hypothetical protein
MANARYTLTLTWTTLGLQNHDPTYDANGNLNGGYPYRRSQAIKVALTPNHVVYGPGGPGDYVANHITDTTSGAVWVVSGDDQDITNMINTWTGKGYVTVTKAAYPPA